MDRGRVLVYNNIFIYIYIDGWNSSISIWSTIGVRISNIQWGSEPIQKLRFRRPRTTEINGKTNGICNRTGIRKASRPCFFSSLKHRLWQSALPPRYVGWNEKWSRCRLQPLTMRNGGFHYSSGHAEELPVGFRTGGDVAKYHVAALRVGQLPSGLPPGMWRRSGLL